MKTPTLSSATTPFLFIFTIITASLPFPAASLGSSSTIAISYDSNSTTVCGIIAGNTKQGIQCFNQGKRIISVKPNLSYHSISGGRRFFCGLVSGNITILLCWDTTNFQARRLYHSSDHKLKDLTVGDSQVCAIQAATGVAYCWRFDSLEPALTFNSITSGRGFSCGVMKNNRVTCWGVSEIADRIQTQFGNFTMLSLVAGESHACGLTKKGALICGGSNFSGQLEVPPHSAFGFSAIALGSNHSCAIHRENGSVICWGRSLSVTVGDLIRNISFELIAAGLDLTCGLTTKNLSIICWGPGFDSWTVLPLVRMIPGPCVQTSCSSCGIYLNSDSLCADSGNICRSCEAELPIATLVPPSRAPLPAGPPLKEKNKLFLAFGIVGFFGVFAGICTVIYCLWSSVCRLFNSKIHNSEQPNMRRQRSGTSLSHPDKPEIFSLPVLAAAAGDFSPENKIGGGSFGTVYKGKLANGCEVAIKRGAKTDKEAKNFQAKEGAFGSEVTLLSRVHHKHLVKLVGFCRENDEWLLVYEYMANGSLHDHLHNNHSIVLNSWNIRIKIAVDSARGIEYLHNYAVPTIIHRDIKSSNILLDANFNAKVSDFGLSLMGPVEFNHELMSIKAVGTVGYIDPEYYVLNTLTEKSDVYGFGVVLLELLTGKRAVFRKEGMPMSLVEFAKPKILDNKLMSILDKRMGSPEMGEVEAVQLVAYTAMHCLGTEREERPNMTEIVANLERALALL